MRPTQLLVSLSFALGVAAHGQILSAREIAEHQAVSKRCAVKAGAYSLERKKRSLTKRTLTTRSTNVTIHIEEPHMSTIKNETCVLVPDTMAGPYVYPPSQILRQDMRGKQIGVPLYLDIGILDIETCEPAPNVLLELWHCNATGSYSSFEEISPNAEIPYVVSVLGSPNNGLHKNDTNWLRGLWPTDDNGVLEMASIFPGFYNDRTVHIHARAHTNWTIRTNGTIVGSNIASTAQLYFDEDITAKVMATEPYSSHTEVPRLRNWEDGLFENATVTGWDPTFEIEPLDGVDPLNGMVGYLTLGINTSYTSTPGCSFDCADAQHLDYYEQDD